MEFDHWGGLGSYSGQNAQNPQTSRRVLSWIPQSNGELAREPGEPLWSPTQLPAAVGSLIQYDYNDNNGVQHTVFFAATTQSIYKLTGAIPTWTWVIQTLPMTPAGGGAGIGGLTSTTPISGVYPKAVVINNLLHVADGTTSWIYDGPNNQWVIDGFAIPLDLPTVVDGGAGAVSAVVGKYYWFTYADETVGRVHESSSSAISATTGPYTNRQQTVSPTTGNADFNSGSTAVVGHSTNFLASQIGMHIYANGVDQGTIVAVASTTSLTLAANPPNTVNGASILIAPVRATHIHIYASEVDGSKLGQYLGKIVVTANPPTFTDNSPFTNQAGFLYTTIQRPIRNDPPVASSLMETHKFRIFRRRETKPNFLNITAKEEVSSGNGNGSPEESTPGTDPKTLSDIINENSYPRQSNRIRALTSHADALYVGTEKETIPYYGDSFDSFGFSEVVTFKVGQTGRWGMISTAHGLEMFTSDRRFMVYPPISPIFALTPQQIDVTDQLKEIGLPMRKKFLTVLNTALDNIRVTWYNFNSRDWTVICLQDNTSAYHTYVYDWTTKGWFELQRGFASLAVFEPTPGVRVLVGGGSDGFTYVVDDLTGQFAAAATLPTALFRTALIDFGAPERLHAPDYIEYEVTNAALVNSITVNFYLDPVDADNPGTPIALAMQPVSNRPNLFRGFFATALNEATGIICKRLMVELNVASDANAGALRGVVLTSDPVPELMQ